MLVDVYRIAGNPKVEGLARRGCCLEADAAEIGRHAEADAYSPRSSFVRPRVTFNRLLSRFWEITLGENPGYVA